MRRQVTRRLTRLQTMYNVLKYAKHDKIMTKIRATQPHRNWKFRQCNNDQYCKKLSIWIHPFSVSLNCLNGLYLQSSFSYLNTAPTRETFMTILSDIEGFLIRATYNQQMSSVTLRDVSMDTAVASATGNTAMFVGLRNKCWCRESVWNIEVIYNCKLTHCMLGYKIATMKYLPVPT